MSIKMLVDTGAIISVISNQFVTDRSLTNNLEKCNERAVVADGRSVKIDNFLRGILTVNNFCKEVCLYSRFQNIVCLFVDRNSSNVINYTSH